MDDQRDKHITFEDVFPTDPTLHITFDNMKIVLGKLKIHLNVLALQLRSHFVEFLESEMKKLEEQASLLDSCTNPSKLPDLQPNKVIQSVKYVINLMSSLCTIDIMDAVDGLIQTCGSLGNRSVSFCKIQRSNSV